MGVTAKCGIVEPLTLCNAVLKCEKLAKFMSKKGQKS